MPPTFDRTNLVSGPGSLLLGTQKFFAKEGISVKPVVETFQPEISSHGKGAPRIQDAHFETTFTPSGKINADLIAALFPAGLANPVPGTALLGSSDVALKVHGVDGTAVTFPNSVITGLPDLLLSPDKTAIGEVTITSLIKKTTARGTTGSLYSSESEAWSETFDDDDIVCVPYTATYNSADLPTKEGWNCTFELELDAVPCSGVGIVQYLIKGVTAKASCIPLGWSVATLLGAQNLDGLAIGASMRQSKNLVITGAAGGLSLTLYDAVAEDAPMRWMPLDTRADTVTFTSAREISGTAPDTTLGAVYALSVVS